MDDSEAQWNRMKQQLLAQARGDEPPRVTSTRTLFGIPSTGEEKMERFAAQIEAERAERAEARLRRREQLMEDHPVLDVADVAALEQRIAAGGTSLGTLMQRAGAAVAAAACEHAEAGGHVVVLAGTGNNGGDGWVAARLLADAGRRVMLACPVAAADITAEPAHTEALRTEAAAGGNGAGGRGPSGSSGEIPAGSLRVLVAPGAAEVATAVRDACVVIDALLGTGFAHDTLREPIAGWVRALGAARARSSTVRPETTAARATTGHTTGAAGHTSEAAGQMPCVAGGGKPYVISCDVPSGINAQTGTAADPHVTADTTVTMLVLKPGLLTGAGGRATGELSVAELCDVGPFL